MSKIILKTSIHAPIERCFDLSRSVDLHLLSAEKTKEKAIAGVTTGLMTLGDIVTWEAIHFNIKQKLTVEITSYDRPNHFQDSQIKGIFSYFKHDHFFEEKISETIMTDIFDFKCPMGIFGKLAEPLVHNHLKKFLVERNNVIKNTAESDQWKKLL